MNRLRLCALLVAPVAVLGNIPIQAAESDVVTSRIIEEVVVTSRKREESLQKVPIAVTAITDVMIREMRIDNIEDVATVIPNLVIHTSAGGSPSAVACMRGMCRTNTILTEDPMVGTYVDGVYLGKAVGSLVDVLELERIEVLRGPQGTLYGKNTLGGAINMITRKPSGEFGADVQVRAGNEGLLQLRAGVDFPITERLAARVNYLNKQRDPVVENPLGENYGDSDLQAGMIALNWEAGDNFNVSYKYDATSEDQLSDLTSLSFANTPVYTDPSDPSTCISGCTLVGWDIIGVDISQNVTPEFSDTYDSDGVDHHQKLDIQGHALIMDWDLNESTSLKSITSYREVEADYALSYGVQIFYASRTVDTESFSQEFQLNGLAMSERLNYTLSLFYYEEEGVETNTQDIPGFFAHAGYAAEIESESYAAFGEMTYAMTDSLDITLGLRYTVEDKSADKIAFTLPDEFIFMDTYEGTYNGSTVLPDGTPVHYKRDIENDSLSPRMSLSYAPTDDWMFYATYAKGYKSGGFNAASTSPNSWEPFDDVELDSFEAGFKSTLWSGRAQLNISAFYSEAEDMQVQVNGLSPVGTFEAIITNAGQSEVTGLEVEMLIRPTDRLDLNFGLGLQDAEFTEFLQPDGSGGMVDVSADRVLEFTPDYTYNAGIRYVLAETGNGVWNFRADVHGMGKHDFQPVPAQEVASDSYDLVSARLGLDEVEFGGGILSVSVWGTNLTDESYRRGGFTFTDDFGFNSYGQPRMYGADLEYRF